MGLVAETRSRRHLHRQAIRNTMPSMENKPPGSYLNRPQKIAMLLVIGANVLVWSVLALSIVDRSGPPFAAHGTSTPVVTFTFTSIVLVSPSPTFTPSMLPVDSPTVNGRAVGDATVDDTTTVPLPATTPISTPTLAVPMLPISDDTLVIALLGIDEERTSNVWRTDSIILVFIQEAKRVGVLSVPRDLWVYIPDHGHGRINTVDALGEQMHHPGGGLTLLDKTFRHNLGVPIDHAVRIDFHGFVRIIDAVGGVTVNVEKPIEDTFPDPLSETGEFQMALPAGAQHLDGRTTLSYCRSRMTTSDFDRSRRQRQVLVALWEQAFTLETLAQAPQLWATFGDAFETDLTVAQAVQLAHLVYGIEPSSVHSKSLDSATVRPWTTPQGEQVLLPQTDAIRQLLLDLLSLPDE
jgi:LCP family protein required for cell wall assembly